MATGLTWLFGLYLAATTVYIIAQNRRPSATFAWVLLFASLPGVGVVLYLLFGQNHRPTLGSKTLMRQEVLGHVQKLTDSLAPQHKAGLQRLDADRGVGGAIAKLVQNTAHSTLTTQNRVQLLQDADEAYPRLFDDLRAARGSIHMQYYSWGSDDLGDQLMALLGGKAAEGVEVRILYDPVGSMLMLRRGYVRAMRAAGVDMRPFSELWRLHTLSYRNHRKIAVIDGRVAHTGGLNIGDEHLKPPEGFRKWRDTNLRIEGAAVSVLQAVFAVDWQNASDEDLFQTRFFPVVAAAEGAGVPVQITLSGPDTQWQAIRQLYFAMIAGARRQVTIQTPFFILDDSIAEALKAAALAGVRVRIMVSERGTGQYLPYWANNTFMAEVAAAGCEVWLYRTGYLHAKTVSADGAICSIGSANIDPRSFSINYELNAVVYDPGVAQAIEAAFERDLKDCVRFTVDGYLARGRLVRFRDSAARLLSPLM